MLLLILPALLALIVFAPVINRAFQQVLSSPDPKTRRRAEYGKIIFLWAVIATAPMFLISLSSHLSIFALIGSFAFGLIFATIGTAILSRFVSPGSRFATVLGIIIGGVLAPLVLWTLALVMPKNEGTMGYFLFGFILAVPNALAGGFAGNLYASMSTPRPLAERAPQL
jgi:hypothetical protein